jgi:hypothetical protein
MEAFIAGTHRSSEDVRHIEGLFATSRLDDDPRFSDLQSALALFGASEREHDTRTLASACRYALKLLVEDTA